VPLSQWPLPRLRPSLRDNELYATSLAKQNQRRRAGAADYVRSPVAGYKVPKCILFLPAIPKQLTETFGLGVYGEQTKVSHAL